MNLSMSITGAAIVLLVLSVVSMVGASDFFVSEAVMKHVLESEKQLIDALRLHVEEEGVIYQHVKQNFKLEKIKDTLKDYIKENKEATAHMLEYINNPLNLFLLLRRLSTSWYYLEQEMLPEFSKSYQQKAAHLKEHLPTAEVTMKLMAAIIKLQRYYGLNATDMASGKLPGVESNGKEFSALDCFDLGYHAVTQRQFYYAIGWLEQAYERVQDEEYKTTESILLLEHIAESYRQVGDYQSAYDYTLKILKEDPEHSNAMRNKYIIGREKFKGSKALKEPWGEDLEQTELCRNTTTKKKNDHLMKCYNYVPEGTAFVLRPAKAEVINLNPKMVLVHDVISKNTIRKIQKYISPVLGMTGHNDIHAVDLFIDPAYNVGRTVWLDRHHAVASNLTERLAQLTRLSKATAEDFRITLHGIGGEVLNKIDYAKPGDKIPGTVAEHGNRYATANLFFTNADAGGYIVYPRIGVKVEADEGSVLFYYNLKGNHAGDIRTEHSICPVITGKMIIAQMWFHEAGQHLTRSCKI